MVVATVDSFQDVTMVGVVECRTVWYMYVVCTWYVYYFSQNPGSNLLVKVYTNQDYTSRLGVCHKSAC
jgi:hypothetical protein